MNPTTTSPLATRPMRADARRNHQRVLEAARELFAEQGIEAQIDDIAHRAKVGVGTVYRHFPTKEDLLEALAEQRFEWLAERAREALAEEDGWSAFCGFLRDAVARQATDVALGEAMGSRPEMVNAVAQRAGMLELLQELVSRAQAEGKLRDDVTGADVPMIFCGLGGVAKAGSVLEFMRWDRLLELIIDGLAAPQPSKLP